MLAETLLEEGVSPEQVDVIPQETDAVDAALRMGRPDDLILILADALQRTWNQITRFRPDATAAAEAEAPDHEAPAAPLPKLPQHSVALGGRLIRDERGISLAPELSD